MYKDLYHDKTRRATHLDMLAQECYEHKTDCRETAVFISICSLCIETTPACYCSLGISIFLYLPRFAGWIVGYQPYWLVTCGPLYVVCCIKRLSAITSVWPQSLASLVIRVPFWISVGSLDRTIKLLGFFGTLVDLFFGSLNWITRLLLTVR